MPANTTELKERLWEASDQKFALAQAKLTARFSNLLQLPESTDIAKAINDAVRAIEADNVDLKGVPKTEAKFDRPRLVSPSNKSFHPPRHQFRTA